MDMPHVESGAGSSLRGQVQEAVDILRGVVGSPGLGVLSGDEAYGVANLLGEAAQVANAGVALLAPVVVAAGNFTRGGHASAADWLGSVCGSSTSVAKGRLVASARAAQIPEVAKALQEGQLSPDQLKLVTETAAVAPESSGPLLALVAEGASHGALAGEANRQRAAARKIEDERQMRQRVHNGRHLRWRQDPNGGIRGDFWCDEVAWSKVNGRLEAETQARWKAAGSGDSTSLEAHRMDAFIDLMSSGGGKGGGGGRNRALLVADVAALHRGTTEGDELCEIEGVGPVSVQAAREFLGDASLQFVIKDGQDIKCVTGTTRTIPQRLKMALLVRDRQCVRPSCGNTKRLEIDHQVPFKDGGPTELNNLARLCSDCHDLKTYGDWDLQGKPGHFEWVAPANPPTAGQIARRRKVAAAKAKGGRKQNQPRRA
jgi:hypothetical protein